MSFLSKKEHRKSVIYGFLTFVMCLKRRNIMFPKDLKNLVYRLYFKHCLSERRHYLLENKVMPQYFTFYTKTCCLYHPEARVDICDQLYTILPIHHISITPGTLEVMLVYLEKKRASAVTSALSMTLTREGRLSRLRKRIAPSWDKLNRELKRIHCLL